MLVVAIFGGLFFLVASKSIRAIDLSTHFGGSAVESPEEEVTTYLERQAKDAGGSKPASVRCAPSGALRYVRDLMPQAETANSCEVTYPDGTVAPFCVISGEGRTLLLTPQQTCDTVAASYGRGPGRLEPGELTESLTEAER